MIYKRRAVFFDLCQIISRVSNKLEWGYLYDLPLSLFLGCFFIAMFYPVRHSPCCLCICRSFWSLSEYHQTVFTSVMKHSFPANHYLHDKVANIERETVSAALQVCPPAALWRQNRELSQVNTASGVKGLPSRMFLILLVLRFH